MNFCCDGVVNCYPDDKNILNYHIQYDQVIDIDRLTNQFRHSSDILRLPSDYIDQLLMMLWRKNTISLCIDFQVYNFYPII